MSGVARSIDTEREIPVDVEGRAYPVGTCHMCGAEGPVFEGAVELPDGSGGWTYELGRRCVETSECRKRRQGTKTNPPAPASEPMDAETPTQPDAQPKEARRVDWL